MLKQEAEIMLRHRRTWELTVVLLAFALTSACGSNSGLDLFPAEGTVQYEGQPVAGATVVFTPATKSDESQKDAQAETDENGHFAIQTFDGTAYHSGVKPGEYVVSVTKLELPKDMRGQPKHVLPKRYRSTSTTTLKATVSADEETPFDFELHK